MGLLKDSISIGTGRIGIAILAFLGDIDNVPLVVEVGSDLD